MPTPTQQEVSVWYDFVHRRLTEREAMHLLKVKNRSAFHSRITTITKRLAPMFKRPKP